MADNLVALITGRSKRIRPLPTAAEERGRLPRRPRAALFDVYGTLLARIGGAHPNPARMIHDIEGIIERHRLPVTVTELEGRVRELVAREHSAQEAQGNASPEVRIETVWAALFPDRTKDEIRVMIVEHEIASHPAWPMPGSRRLLRSLSRAGLTLGIVSNAQFYTPLFLNALLGASPEELGFSRSLCLYSCDFGVAKPGRLLFDVASERLREIGHQAAEAVMIGNDYRNDIHPAARSGFMTVHAALDRRSWVSAGDESPRADAIVTSLTGLASLIAEAR